MENTITIRDFKDKHFKYSESDWLEFKESLNTSIEK